MNVRHISHLKTTRRHASIVPKGDLITHDVSEIQFMTAAVTYSFQNILVSIVILKSLLHCSNHLTFFDK